MTDVQNQRALVLALLEDLWRDYVAITPQAPRIHALLAERGESVVNDHVALRTFALPGLAAETLAFPFTSLGYVMTGAYDFPDKQLSAWSFSHEDQHDLPRVFISQLDLDRVDDRVADTVRAVVAAQDLPLGDGRRLLRAPWRPCTAPVYERLLADSEYAAWTAAFGVRVNHFTVHVNALSTFSGIAPLAAWLVDQGFRLNGGDDPVQGGPEVLLAQCSTVASRIPWVFADDLTREIPGCYYEFAERFPDPATGRLYDGFVTSSADRLFESTDSRHHAS